MLLSCCLCGKIAVRVLFLSQNPLCMNIAVNTLCSFCFARLVCSEFVTPCPRSDSSLWRCVDVAGVRDVIFNVLPLSYLVYCFVHKHKQKQHMYKLTLAHRFISRAHVLRVRHPNQFHRVLFWIKSVCDRHCLNSKYLLGSMVCVYTPNLNVSCFRNIRLNKTTNQTEQVVEFNTCRFGSKLHKFVFIYFHCYCKTTRSVCITKSFSLFSDWSATSPTRHRLSISRKPLIAAKVTRINSFTVKSQLIDPLNNAVVLCTEAIMGPLLVNHIPLSYRTEKHPKLMFSFGEKSQTSFLLSIFMSVPIKSILWALFRCIEFWGKRKEKRLFLSSLIADGQRGALKPVKKTLWLWAMQSLNEKGLDATRLTSLRKV